MHSDQAAGATSAGGAAKVADLPTLRQLYRECLVLIRQIHHTGLAPILVDSVSAQRFEQLMRTQELFQDLASSNWYEYLGAYQDPESALTAKLKILETVSPACIFPLIQGTHVYSSFNNSKPCPHHVLMRKIINGGDEVCGMDSDLNGFRHLYNFLSRACSHLRQVYDIAMTDKALLQFKQTKQVQRQQVKQRALLSQDLKYGPLKKLNNCDTFMGLGKRRILREFVFGLQGLLENTFMDLGIIKGAAGYLLKELKRCNVQASWGRLVDCSTELSKHDKAAYRQQYENFELWLSRLVNYKQAHKFDEERHHVATRLLVHIVLPQEETPDVFAIKIVDQQQFLKLIENIKTSIEKGRHNWFVSLESLRFLLLCRLKEPKMTSDEQQLIQELLQFIASMPEDHYTRIKAFQPFYSRAIALQKHARINKPQGITGNIVKCIARLVIPGFNPNRGPQVLIVPQDHPDRRMIGGYAVPLTQMPSKRFDRSQSACFLPGPQQVSVSGLIDKFDRLRTCEARGQQYNFDNWLFPAEHFCRRTTRSHSGMVAVNLDLNVGHFNSVLEIAKHCFIKNPLNYSMLEDPSSLLNVSLQECACLWAQATDALTFAGDDTTLMKDILAVVMPGSGFQLGVGKMCLTEDQVKRIVKFLQEEDGYGHFFTRYIPMPNDQLIQFLDKLCDYANTRFDQDPIVTPPWLAQLQWLPEKLRMSEEVERVNSKKGRFHVTEFEKREGLRL